MAKKKITGITIEIGGNTTKLNEALQKSNAEIRESQKELIEVEKLLKNNQDNTELQRQKQESLTTSIEKTKEKLEILKKANDDVARSASNYDSWKAKYDPIKKEIDETRKRLAELRDEQELLNKVGDIDTDSYKNLQEEIKETEKRLNGLKKEAKAVSEEFGNPVSPEQYNAFQRDIIATEAELKKLSEQLDDTSNASNKTGSEFSQAREKLSGICDIAKGGAILEVGEQIEELGAKAQEAGAYIWNLADDYTNATTRASAYFGETGAKAEQTASIIENVYLGGVGDSLGQVSDAVISVKKNIEGLDQQTMENITQQVITLDELYGIDMNETLRGVNSLMVQFGTDAQTAMDMIVAGTQNGLDKTNELGDNVAEYAGKFAQAGYSAEEYFQLLNNGLDGGAYNLDKVNDAINEVTTRLSDGTISDAIGTYSQETQNLFEAWQNGEVSQKAVIDSIVEDIGRAQTEQEALNLAATAFGTIGEDFNLRFVQSLSSVGTAYEDVSGKAQNMYQQTTTPQQELTAKMRELQEELAPIGIQLMELASQILPPLMDVVKRFLGFLSENPTLMNIILAIGTIISVLGTLMPIISAVAGAVAVFGSSVLAPIIGIIAGVVAAISLVVAAFTNWGTITEWLGNLVSTVWESIKTNIHDGVTETKETISNTISAIESAWSAGWTSIKTIATNVVTNIRNMISSWIENIKEKIRAGMEAIRQTWDAMKTNVVQTVTVMKDNTIGLFGNLKDKAIEIVENLKSAIGGKISQVKDTIIDGIGEAVDWIKELPSQAIQWGKDLIDGFIEGIRSMLDDLGDVVDDVVSSVTDFLHFSRPDKGPLRYYEEWMPHMMQGLAKGIHDNRYLVEDEIKSLANNISEFVNQPQARQPVNLQNQTVINMDGRIVAETVNERLGILL